jgi:RND family efflux transporter MFP subunit
MKQTKHTRWRALWVLPPLVLGILMLVYMGSGKQPPTRTERGEPTQPVRVVEALQVDLLPEAKGYGEVQPAKVWAAVAQVAGRIIDTYPRLRDGEIVPAGTLLFSIDPVDYELKLAQAKAELTEMDVQEQNAQASLAIDKGNLRLAQREQERIRKLSSSGTASQSDVDAAERAALNARTAVQNTANTLALLPTQRRLLEAKVRQAERDLANTRVTAPFNLRIAELAIEKHQYVGVGQTLFKGDAVERVEIVAQVAISSLRKLLLGRELPVPAISDLQNELQNFTGFRPIVRMDMGAETAEWEANFVRFSDQVDPQTRTIGVVVSVDNPFGKIIPGKRPPLSKGMFVQVVIRGHVQPDRIILPRSAVRAGKVYLVGEDKRLLIKPVSILFSQGPLSIIADGIELGELVVVSDPIPAVEGMLLEPVPDIALQAQMLATAKGEQ